MDDHIVLVGMMGTGKSTIGRLVADGLDRPFVDSDDQVEGRTGRTVREIFERDGEAAYRRLESAALAEALDRPDPAVIAAAGGTVLDPANRTALRAAGLVVWLRAEPEVLAERVEGAHHRPLLAHDPIGTLHRLDAERRPFYAEVADVEIPVGDGDAEQAAAAVLDLVRARAATG